MIGFLIVAGLAVYLAVMIALARCMTGDTEHVRRRSSSGHAAGTYRKAKQ